MRCEKIQPWLSAVVDEEEIGVWGWVVRRHVAHCPACREELRALRALEVRLVAVSPITRRPILRPMGLARPLLAVGALAAAGAGVFLWQPPKSEHPVTVALASPVPKATPSPSTKPRLAPKPVPPVLRLKVARHHPRRVRRPATVAEQVVIVAKAPPTAKPLTLVHDSREDDGGTIHLETTIPAAYVAAMQTASLTSGETKL